MKQTFIIIISFLYTVGLSFGQTSTKIDYKSFDDFYTYIAKNSTLKWTELKLRDTLTTRITIGPDKMEEVFSFTVDSLKIKYHTIKEISAPYPVFLGASYFTYNDKIILDTIDKYYNGLEDLHFYKTNLIDTGFLFIHGSPTVCNGTFCLICLDNCFKINGGKINCQVIQSWINPPNIYCDLNSDGQLDMISFTNNCNPKYRGHSPNEGGKYIFCIKAYSLIGEKWTVMTDKKNNPYFIDIQVDDFYKLDNLKVLDYNWLYEL